MPFLQAISSIIEWERNMNINEARYMYEHILLPKFFFEEGMNLIGGLITEKDFAYQMMKKVCDDNAVEMPYPKELFLFEQFKTEDKILGGKIFLPAPTQASACYVIYLLFNLQFDKIRFFTVERGEEETDVILGEWTKDGEHLNHGKADLRDSDGLNQAIAIYRSVQ